MAVWTGHNWQFIETGDAQAVIGIAFGIGLLDEAVSSTGALSIALSALRAELSQPVDVGDGTFFVPDVEVSLCTDTATLTIRGSREGVSATWRRLPGLFVPGTVHADVPLLRPEPLAWPADVVHRTGHNAAALGWLKTTAPDAHGQAAALLPRLDPRSRAFPAVFFTNDKFLVGLAFPIEPVTDIPPLFSGPDDVVAAPRSLWADGTPACTDPDRAGQEPSTVSKGDSSHLDGSLGISQTGIRRVLLSALVPRSTGGQLAAELLRRKAAAIGADTIGHRDGLGLELQGAGAASMLVVTSGQPISGPDRNELLKELGKALALVPDAWIHDAVADAGASDPRLERERRLMGLPAESAATVFGVRKAISDAVSHTLRLNFVLASSGFGDAKQADAGLPQPGSEQVFKTRVGRVVHEARVDSWDPTPPPAWISSLIVGRDNIRLGGLQAGHGQRAPITDGVATTAAIAVLEDPAGTVVVVDDQLRTLTLQPELFHRPDKLRQVLSTRLAGVPRLAFTSTVDPAKLKSFIRQKQRAKLWPIVGAAAVVGAVVGLSALNNTSDPVATERIAFGETAQLSNGTTITVGNPELGAEGLLRTAAVDVRFCAGGDTKAKGLPPETRRSIAPADFLGFNKGAGNAQLVDSSGGLHAAVLADGQCTTGSLTFGAPQLENPRFAYKNQAGDDVVWYPAGELPDGK
ncbi:hypothetical protein [Arthrobacter sp. HY1533]|uniref:hypothetical protein n=1 Tax=Arthrobacter sp. HY1533 TaxID=2970919 RepID=UPI0022B9E03A|nr:hypothetical protein [Arthrobacter sp. HY1533]